MKLGELTVNPTQSNVQEPPEILVRGLDTLGSSTTAMEILFLSWDLFVNELEFE